MGQRFSGNHNKKAVIRDIVDNVAAMLSEKSNQGLLCICHGVGLEGDQDLRTRDFLRLCNPQYWLIENAFCHPGALPR